MSDNKDIEFFIESILGTMHGNAVMGLLDHPGSTGKLNRFTDYKYPEQLDDMVEFANSHRNEDVYLSPLTYGEMRNDDKDSFNYGKVRRIPENALESNTIYQDSDTCPPEKFRLRPSVHLTSSTGRYQDFWVLNESIPAARAADISRRIAQAHKEDGSDPSSWSANKMLRVPYSTNTRHGFPEDVQVQFTGDIYYADDVQGAYDDIDLVERPIIRLPADVSYESPQDLPDYASALDKLPKSFDLKNLTAEVPANVDRSRMRYRLLCDLFRTGTLTFEDVLSLAWHAPASQKWRDDSRNIRGLIAEALKAQTEVSYESGSGVEPAEPASPTNSFGLLSEAERDSIAGDDNWLTRWNAFCARKLDRAYNAPYARLNGLTVLSAALSDACFIPMGNGPENCNLYGIGIGDSGSGKTQSLKLWIQMMNEIFMQDKGWDIGSNASPNALHEKLIERDGKVSVLNADEAHGWFATINSQQWAEGTYENLAKYFDGRVPPILRTGNRELSGKSASTYFLINFFGTRKGDLSITNVLNRSMFLSGFLARFIWYIGESREVTEESLAETQSNGEYFTLGHEPQLRQWAAEFVDTKKVMRQRNGGKDRIAMMMDSDALRRLSKAKWAINRMYQGHAQWDILEPALIRIGGNIRRVATLLAFQEKSNTITLRHTLLAIELGEEWLKNLVTMAELVSDSDWKRTTDSVFTFIQSKGQRTKREVVLRKFAGLKPREMAEVFASLKDQGFIEERTENGSMWIVNRLSDGG